MRKVRPAFVLASVVFVTAFFHLTLDQSQAETMSHLQNTLDDASPALAIASSRAAEDRELPLELRLQLADKSEQRGRPPIAPAASITDWQTAIDTTWGSGLSTAEKWVLYDSMWTLIDEDFACFPGVTLDWDSVKAVDIAEITGGVSRGRFCAIMQYATHALHELHTNAFDTLVWNTAGDPGVPILYRGDWGPSARFGAGLTPLPDSTLLVYRVGAGHPLGLEPGDRVLGYDGTLWKDLYPTLLAAHLPVKWSQNGSSEASETHRMLAGAGRNWHLFDTIDVVKHATGDTVHLPTSLLTSSTAYTFNDEEMDIPGVPKPEEFNGDYFTPGHQWCSWGIIDGTSIGYIYVVAWAASVDTLWYNAIDSLMNYNQTTGLIVDFRLNYGGNMFLSNDGLSLLLKDTVLTIDWVQRCNALDHNALCDAGGPPENYQIPGDPNSYYDKPIAVLVGPGAGSSGDQVALRMSYHALTKFFGKPTDGGFSTPAFPDLGDFSFRYALGDCFQVSAPGTYLDRRGFPNPVDYPSVPFKEVWLTPDGVANGRDDVVDSAVAWILSLDTDQDGVINDSDNCPMTYNPAQEDGDSNGVGDSCECNVVVVDNTGDTNADGVTNASDVIVMVNFVFKSGAEPQPCVAAMDVNCDGVPNASDIIYAVNYVFKSGSPPCDVCTLIPGTWTCP